MWCFCEKEKKIEKNEEKNAEKCLTYKHCVFISENRVFFFSFLVLFLLHSRLCIIVIARRSISLRKYSRVWYVFTWHKPLVVARRKINSYSIFFNYYRMQNEKCSSPGPNIVLVRCTQQCTVHSVANKLIYSWVFDS